MNKLNDSCLLHIFNYLEIVDLLKVESVCKKWQRLSQKSWPRIEELSKNDLHCWGLLSSGCMKIEDEILEKIFRRFGKHLKYINLGGFYDLGIRLLSSMVQTCSNLQGLNLGDILEIACDADAGDNDENSCSSCKQIRLQACDLLNSWPNFQQLPKLSIQTDFYESDLANLFANMKKLETLEIVYKLFYYFPISLPENLPFHTLKEIILICDIVDVQDLGPLIPVLKRIHALQTAVFYNLMNLDIFPEVLIPNAATLTTLGLDFGDDESFLFRDKEKFMGILKLVNLERLFLQKIVFVNDEFLEQLVQTCKKLVYLNISSCENITDVGISHLFKLPALKYLLIDEAYLRGILKMDSLFLQIDYRCPMLVEPK